MEEAAAILGWADCRGLTLWTQLFSILLDNGNVRVDTRFTPTSLSYSISAKTRLKRTNSKRSAKQNSQLLNEDGKADQATRSRSAQGTRFSDGAWSMGV